MGPLQWHDYSQQVVIAALSFHAVYMEQIATLEVNSQSDLIVTNKSPACSRALNMIEWVVEGY